MTRTRNIRELTRRTGHEPALRVEYGTTDEGWIEVLGDEGDHLSVSFPDVRSALDGIIRGQSAPATDDRVVITAVADGYGQVRLVVSVDGKAVLRASPVPGRRLAQELRAILAELTSLGGG